MADNIFALHGQLSPSPDPSHTVYAVRRIVRRTHVTAGGPGLLEPAFYRCADNALFSASARLPEWALWLRSFVHPALPWPVVAVLMRLVRRNSAECRESEEASQPGTAVWRVAQVMAYM